MVLLPIAFLWWRGKAILPKWLWIYGWVRLGVILLALLLHAIGVLYQEPRIMVFVGGIVTAMFLVILHRLRKAQSGTLLVKEPKKAAAPADAA